MLDVCLLGTGGTVPLPDRWLTSCYVRCEGMAALIDCGEGTQIALHKERISCKHIDLIFLTHFHADHTAGLPGLLLSMAKADRTDPIMIIGPKGIEDLLKGVMLIARYVPFEIYYRQIEGKEETFEFGNLSFTAFHVKHSVPCYGYEINVKRTRRFDPKKAEENGIPKKFWGLLQKGQTVEHEGRTYDPEMVLGDERKGIKMVYSTDTRPCDSLREHAKGTDLLITEGMYGVEDGLEKAVANKHMTMQEAAVLAREADTKCLWLTHYSPIEHNVEEYAEELRAIFENTVLSKDGERADLAFAHEEVQDD
ncbi:MAG: ribonuclease Z [Solobacterium sp.]|nr:ribonuclease Z [Solobacterium sp.]